MAGLLDSLNNPLMGLAAGLLSGRDPGGTFAGGMNQGLFNMQNMQQNALHGSLLKSKIDEIKQQEEDRKRWQQIMAGSTPGFNPNASTPQISPVPGGPQMSPAEPGLLGGQPQQGGLLNQIPPDVRTMLSAMPPEQGQAFMANLALQQMKPQNVDQTADIQNYEFLVKQGVPSEEAMRRVFTQSTGASPYYSPIQTANGIYAFDARSGNISPIMAGDQQLIGSASDPKLQGAIAGAKVGGEATAKRDTNMAGLGSIIGRARSVLSGDTPPTGSTFGTMADSAAGMFGKTPKGAAEADQLRAIGGALVAKMPRMEGPQSDFDVKNYKEMAGQVGDSTLPIPRRMAALSEVERIWLKYDKQNANDLTSGTIERNSQPAGATVLKFDANGNPIQ